MFARSWQQSFYCTFLYKKCVLQLVSHKLLYKRYIHIFYPSLHQNNYSPVTSKLLIKINSSSLLYQQLLQQLLTLLKKLKTFTFVSRIQWLLIIFQPYFSVPLFSLFFLTFPIFKCKCALALILDLFASLSTLFGNLFYSHGFNTISADKSLIYTINPVNNLHMCSDA